MNSKRSCCRILLVLAAVASAAAAGKPPTAPALLGVVPAIPTTAEAAYAQWTDDNGTLKPGAAFKSVEDGVQTATARNGTAVGAAATQPGLQAVRAAQTALEQQWKMQLESLDRQEQQARSALPPCRGETGEPAQAQVRDLALQFAARKIALAAQFLPKFAPLAQQMKAAVETDTSYGDVGRINRFVEDISRQGAAAVANKLKLQRIYASAKEC